MLGVKLKGEWGAIHNMLLRRRARQSSLAHRTMRSVAKNFRREVIKNIPKDEEFKDYRKSIKTRSIRGISRNKMDAAYAVVSVPYSNRVDSLNGSDTVVYAMPVGTAVNPLGMIIMENSPWVPSRLPEDLRSAMGVKLIHRRVSIDEAKRVRERNDKVLKTLEVELRDAGMKARKGKKDLSQESTEDTAFLAMRMEFGINRDRISHWGVAWRKRQAMHQEALKKYPPGKFVFDPNFNGWTQRVRKAKPMSAAKFKARYQKFAQKLEKL